MCYSSGAFCGAFEMLAAPTEVGEHKGSQRGMKGHKASQKQILVRTIQTNALATHQNILQQSHKQKTMKQEFLFCSLLALLALTACNDNSTEPHQGHGTTATTENHTTPTGQSAAKTVSVTYPQVDPTISAALKESVDHYLHVKNALAGDNAAEAAKGATALGAALQKVDKSLFTPEQKTAFDKVAAGLKEHANAIAANAGDIKKQREHFVPLSESSYNLAKAFGGGRTLYHAHCPMAKNNEGALWISETKEIKNPYFGAEMLECGTVEEVIQN